MMGTFLTAVGKANSSRNGLKHGHCSEFNDGQWKCQHVRSIGMLLLEDKFQTGLFHRRQLPGLSPR